MRDYSNYIAGVPFIVILSFVSVVSFAQVAGAHAPDTSPLDARVPSVVVHNGVLLDGLAQLSAQSPDLSFAFEDILRAKLAGPASTQVRFDMDLRNRSVREVLDALCSRDARYAWSLDSLTINVYPRSVQSDSSYLMNRHIRQLEIKEAKDAGETVFAVVAQLPPPFEQVAYAQSGGDISYPVPWNATFYDISVRQAMNAVARHLGPRGGWVFSGSKEFRTIGFHRREIHHNNGEKKETSLP